MNPFDFPRNAPCRKDYRADMCPASLDIVRRTVSISLNPNMDEKAVDGVIERMRRGAEEVG
jgi:dTDP-4-amino-4,6-dideoxygalactose transaminase